MSCSVNSDFFSKIVNTQKSACPPLRRSVALHPCATTSGLAVARWSIESDTGSGREFEICRARVSRSELVTAHSLCHSLSLKRLLFYLLSYFEAHAPQPSLGHGVHSTHGTWRGPTRRSQSFGHGGSTRHMKDGEGEIGSEWGPHAPQPVSRPRGGLHRASV